MGRWFILDVNPEPWAVGPIGYGRRGGKMSAYMGQNAQLATYKEAIKEAMPPGTEIETGLVSIKFFFWRNQAAYTTPQARTHRKHEADATNMQKATEDALQGILYGNDKDNRHVESFVVEQGSEVHGRVVVYIEPWIAFDPDLIPASVWDRMAVKEAPAATVDRLAWNGPDA